MNYSDYYSYVLETTKDYILDNGYTSSDSFDKIIEDVRETLYLRNQKIAEDCVAEAIWQEDIRDMLDSLGQDVLSYYVAKNDPAGLDLVIRDLMIGECYQELRRWWEELER